jgi:ECF transporter S component (folate family)
MQKELKNNANLNIFLKSYWQLAVKQLTDSKMITIAALIVALRVVVKLFKINIASGLGFSLDGYVNSLGSMIYGPIVGLIVGAVSDILGLLITGQMGQFFPPFTLVEMSSSFIFALFFWRRKITVSRALTAKFSVNLVCNIIMTSVFMKWLKYIQLGPAGADAYKIINGVRIAKNLIMFPLEAMIIITVLSFAMPILTRLKLVDKQLCFIEKSSTKNLALQIALFTALSIAIVVAYFLLNDSVDFKFTFNISETIFKNWFK